MGILSARTFNVDNPYDELLMLNARPLMSTVIFTIRRCRGSVSRKWEWLRVFASIC